MKRYLIQVGTVTYAIKGRDLLRKNGFRVKIERKTGENTYGCGYVIVLEGDLKNARELLHQNGVKILDISEE